MPKWHSLCKKDLDTMQLFLFSKRLSLSSLILLANVSCAQSEPKNNSIPSDSHVQTITQEPEKKTLAEAPHETKSDPVNSNLDVLQKLQESDASQSAHQAKMSTSHDVHEKLAVNDTTALGLTQKLNETETKLDQINKTLETMSTDLNTTNQHLKEHEIGSARNAAIDNKIKNDPFNASLWAGVGYLFMQREAHHLINIPLLNFEIGASKSLWNITPFTFLYGGLIFGFGNYTRDLHNTTYVSEEWYYFMHEAVVIGYEQSLGTPYFSLFLEGGPMIQQINFGIRETQTSKVIDLISAQPFGGNFNAGFNINTNPGKGFTCVIRLGATMLIGQAAETTLNYNSAKFNANPILFGPTASIMIRK